MTRHLALLICTLVAFAATLHAARLTLFIDGDNRTAYDASRGKVGRAEWTAAVNARKGTILTNDFQGVNIDVPADKATLSRALQRLLLADRRLLGAGGQHSAAEAPDRRLRRHHRNRIDDGKER